LIGHSEIFYFFKEKTSWHALLQSQGGGKKGKEKNRDENPIIYLTTVLEPENNFSGVYKGDIMTTV
jgi:hypothetical protein